MVTVHWKGDMLFEAEVPSGNNFKMDAYPEAGKNTQGPTPLEAFLSSIAACSGMDVVSILEKKRQVVESYRVEIEGERNPPGDWPRPYKSITVRHYLKGNIDPGALERAVALTDEKYCSAIATLRQCPKVESTWEIE